MHTDLFGSGPLSPRSGEASRGTDASHVQAGHYPSANSTITPQAMMLMPPLSASHRDASTAFATRRGLNCSPEWALCPWLRSVIGNKFQLPEDETQADRVLVRHFKDNLWKYATPGNRESFVAFAYRFFEEFDGGTLDMTSVRPHLLECFENFALGTERILFAEYIHESSGLRQACQSRFRNYVPSAVEVLAWFKMVDKHVDPTARHKEHRLLCYGFMCHLAAVIASGNTDGANIHAADAMVHFYLQDMFPDHQRAVAQIVATFGPSGRAEGQQWLANYGPDRGHTPSVPLAGAAMHSQAPPPLPPKRL